MGRTNRRLRFPAVAFALALGTTAVMVAGSGSPAWAGIPKHVGYLGGVSCAAPSDCVAVGTNRSLTAAIITTASSGKHWANRRVPSGFGPVGISCVGASDVCVAVGRDGFEGAISISSDSGASWGSLTIPSGVSILNAVSCASTSDCVAVGQVDDADGVIVSTTDGGTSWTADTVPDGVFDLSGVSCASPSDCVAVGYAIPGGDNTPGVEIVLTTADGGTTWTSQLPPSDGGMLEAVSCASTTNCIAVGQTTDGAAILSSTDGGATWTSQVVPAGANSLGGVSCPSVMDCVAGGTTNPGFTGLVLATTDGGTSWVSQSVPAKVANVTGASCASISSCYAVGYNGISPAKGYAFQTPLIVACRQGKQTATEPLTLSKCSPVSKLDTSSTMMIDSGTETGSFTGTLTWTTSGQTTLVSASATSPGQGACAAGNTEYDYTGTVTGGTSTYTTDGSPVAYSLCQTPSNKWSLVASTTATL